MAEVISMMLTNFLPSKSVNNDIRNEISRSRTAPGFVERPCLHCNELCHREFEGNLIFNIGIGFAEFLNNFRADSFGVAFRLLSFIIKNHHKAITIIWKVKNSNIKVSLSQSCNYLVSDHLVILIESFAYHWMWRAISSNCNSTLSYSKVSSKWQKWNFQGVQRYRFSQGRQN